MTQTGKKYLRLETASAMYDLDPRWLRQQCLLGAIRASKVARRWHIHVDEIERLFRVGENKKR